MFFPPQIEREPEQEDILATALLLAQSYGDKYPGMDAEQWVDEARDFRKRVKAIGDVFYLSALPEELDAETAEELT